MLSFLPTSRQGAATRRAFSLVEILVTIAIIAIIAGIAIPVMSNVLQSGQDTAARRNAQQIAGIASSASAAGSTAIANAADKEAAVNLLADGVTGEGQFADDVFMVRLDADDRQKTLKYLEFNDGRLAFDPNKNE